MSNFLNFNGNQGMTFKTFTASGTSYTLDKSASTNSVLVSVGGVMQQPGVDYTVSGTTLTSTSAWTAGVQVDTYIIHKPGTAPTIQDNSIDSDHYVDGSIDTAHIAANQIDGTLTKDALIADYSDVTITAADLIMYGDATDSNNTKRDTVQGLLDLASSGGLVWLARATLAGAATYDFESVLSSTYDAYRFVFNGVHLSGANSFVARVSTDNGSNYENSSGDYHSHSAGGDSAATSDNRAATETTTWIPIADGSLIRGLDTDAAHALGGFLEIYEVNNTAHNKFAIWQTSHYDNEGDNAFTVGSVMMNNTQNIDAVQFLSNTGTLDEGTIDCYGYAKS